MLREISGGSLASQKLLNDRSQGLAACLRAGARRGCAVLMHAITRKLRWYEPLARASSALVSSQETKLGFVVPTLFLWDCFLGQLESEILARLRCSPFRLFVEPV